MVSTWSVSLPSRSAKGIPTTPSLTATTTATTTKAHSAGIISQRFVRRFQTLPAYFLEKTLRGIYYQPQVFVLKVRSFRVAQRSTARYHWKHCFSSAFRVPDKFEGTRRDGVFYFLFFLFFLLNVDSLVDGSTRIRSLCCCFAFHKSTRILFTHGCVLWLGEILARGPKGAVLR